LRPVRRQSELDGALRRGEVPLIVGHGLFRVVADAFVCATCGTVDAGGHARVVALGKAAVRAGDWAFVWSWDRVHVDAYDHAVVVAGGASCVRAADGARVFADEVAELAVMDDAEAYCARAAKIEARGRACVYASPLVPVAISEDAVLRSVVSSWVNARRDSVVGAYPEPAGVNGLADRRASRPRTAVLPGGVGQVDPL
jgi:hypothetical protein